MQAGKQEDADGPRRSFKRTNSSGSGGVGLLRRILSRKSSSGSGGGLGSRRESQAATCGVLPSSTAV